MGTIVKSALPVIAMLSFSACAKADCYVNGDGTSWSSRCNSSGSCVSEARPCGSHTRKIPDMKGAPNKLPKYGEQVLIWDGESWRMAHRLSTDSDGELWSLDDASPGLSQQHPMWQSLPSDPKDTPMCTALIDGKQKAWKPHNSICNITDAPK